MSLLTLKYCSAKVPLCYLAAAAGISKENELIKLTTNQQQIVNKQTNNMY